MAAFTLATVLAVGSLAVAGAGVYMQYQGQKAAHEAQDQALALQQQSLQKQNDIEAKRQQQLDLDATRRKREIVRQSIAARSQALSVATNQGAGASSALPGAEGGISGRENINTLGVSQNQQLGTDIHDLNSDIFGINQNITGAYRSAASANAYAGLGSGMTSLGSALLKNEGIINKVGTYASSFFSGFKPNSDAGYATGGEHT